MKIKITESQYDRVLKEETPNIDFKNLYNEVLHTICRKYFRKKSRKTGQNGHRTRQ